MENNEEKKVGRPPKYTPEEFDIKVQSFFQDCIENKKVPTKGGLALYLDTTRETLREYEGKVEYVDALKKAYTLIEEEWVQRLAGNNVAGTIFYLKNAFSEYWRDKQEREHSGKISFDDFVNENTQTSN